MCYKFSLVHTGSKPISKFFSIFYYVPAFLTSVRKHQEFSLRGKILTLHSASVIYLLLFSKRWDGVKIIMKIYETILTIGIYDLSCTRGGNNDLPFHWWFGGQNTLVTSVFLLCIAISLAYHIWLQTLNFFKHSLVYWVSKQFKRNYLKHI